MAAVRHRGRVGGASDLTRSVEALSALLGRVLQPPARPRRAKPRPAKRATLAERFTALVATAMTLLGASMLAAMILNQISASNAEEARRAGDLASAGAALASRAVANADAAALEEVVRGLQHLDQVTHVAVYDRAGARLAGAGPSSERTLTARATVRVGEERVGEIEVGLAAPALLSHMRGVFWAALCAVMSVSVAIPLTRRRIHRAVAPLATLTEFAEQVGPRRLREKIHIATGDEFERLAQAINRMTDRLAASMHHIRKISLIDASTDLPNKDRFAQLVNARAAERGGALGAVMVVSLDRLSQVAHTLGHEAAEEVMALAAVRLLRAVRAIAPGATGEQGTVCARIAPSEFGVLAPDLVEEAAARRFAHQLGAALNQPIGWREQKLQLGVVVGAILLGPGAACAQDAETAVRRGRLAGAHARGEAKAARVYTPALDRQAGVRMRLEREIHEGLQNNEFRAYFQPRVSLRTGRIVGAEALARWRRADGDEVSPSVFVPIAEETGLIGALSEAILRDACWQAAQWRAAGVELSVSVNVCALQFSDERFAMRVLRIIRQCGVDPRQLELEVTESIAMRAHDRLSELLDPLRAAGVRLAIDDFGTGHSSLAALSRLPFDVIKIDQRFTRSLGSDRHAPAIIETILSMADHLGFKTTAEGVEQESQAAFLRQRGCTEAQGYLYGPALCAEEFLALAKADGAPEETKGADLRGFAA